MIDKVEGVWVGYSEGFKQFELVSNGAVMSVDKHENGEVYMSIDEYNKVSIIFNKEQFEAFRKWVNS